MATEWLLARTRHDARRLHDFDCRALWAIVLFILLWMAAILLPSFGSPIAFLAMFALTFKQGDVRL
jgi:hypothetical protein